MPICRRMSNTLEKLTGWIKIKRREKQEIGERTHAQEVQIKIVKVSARQLDVYDSRLKGF